MAIPEYPISRVEHYLARANGQNVQPPDPISRIEHYLAGIAAGVPQELLDDVADLKSQISVLVAEYTSTHDPAVGNVYTPTGVIQNNSAYNYITFPVFGADVVKYYPGQAETNIGICFYKSDDTAITPGVSALATENIITVPTDAAYAKACYRTRHSDAFYVKVCFDFERQLNVNRTLAVVAKTAMDANENALIAQAGYNNMRIISADPQIGYIQTNNGGITVNTNYRYVEFPVTDGAKVFYKTQHNESSQIGIGFYTAEDAFISGVNATNTEQEIDVPDGAWLARASYVNSQASGFYVKIAATFQNLLNASYGNALKLRGAVPSFVLPSDSTAVVGHEYNIYFDNVIRGMDFEKYAIKVNISPTPSNVKLYKKLLRITPEQSDIGVKTVTIEIRTKNGYILIASQTLTLHIVADRTFSGKRVLFIGDSLTNAGIFAAEIQDIMTSEGIESIGTRSTTCRINGVNHTVNHEGRPGWAAYDYTRSVANYKTDFDNPFWDGEKFSFSHYMANSGVSVPDVVCVGLGTNGFNNNGINAMRTIVDSIHEYNANIPVIVSLIAMPATQDGVGYTVKLQSAADLHDKFLTVNAAYISDYEGNADRPNTYVADLYFNLDSEHDFTTIEIPLSSRNPGIWTIQNNNVHPSEYGYLKFADAYYNQIVAVMPE